jgi:hypothetical protein
MYVLILDLKVANLLVQAAAAHSVLRLSYLAIRWLCSLRRWAPT